MTIYLTLNNIFFYLTIVQSRYENWKKRFMPMRNRKEWGEWKMLGAIVGDIVGSVYECHNIKTKNFPLYGRMYPDAGYGGRFGVWITSNNREPYNSSAMCVSPCAWLMDCGFCARAGIWPSHLSFQWNLPGYRTASHYRIACTKQGQSSGTDGVARTVSHITRRHPEKHDSGWEPSTRSHFSYSNHYGRSPLAPIAADLTAPFFLYLIKHPYRMPTEKISGYEEIFYPLVPSPQAVMKPPFSMTMAIDDPLCPILLGHPGKGAFCLQYIGRRVVQKHNELRKAGFLCHLKRSPQPGNLP